MKTFTEMKDYISDEYTDTPCLTCYEDNGIVYIKCLDDGEVLISSEDIPRYKIEGHIGCDIIVTAYGTEDIIWDISIECANCNEVIFDLDNDEV